jgi:hypothetical protein
MSDKLSLHWVKSIRVEPHQNGSTTWLQVYFERAHPLQPEAPAQLEIVIFPADKVTVEGLLDDLRGGPAETDEPGPELRDANGLTMADWGQA